MSVGRGALSAWGVGVLLVAGCIGTNPRWDGVSASGDDDDDGAASAPSDDGGTDESTTGDESSSGLESSWTGDDSSSSAMPSADDGPVCPGDDLVCDGECKNVQGDKHACGADGVDCIALFEAVRNDDFAVAKELSERVWRTSEVFYADPFADMHNRMKEALVSLGRLDRAVVRPPLVKLPQAEIARIAQAMRAAGIERDGATGLGATGLHPTSVAAE